MTELSKTYEPKLAEEKWSAFWEKGRFFVANPLSEKPPYCIVMPPPNVTGVLHMGHALVSTLQDILVRWKRMQGYEVLWVPGTDHAGIATQTVVERNLMKATGKRRKEFSREEFLKHVWEWKEKSQETILSQLRKVGSSCDWSRLAFTMDEERSLAVRTLFKKMFDAGLIYRGDYLVNWDPVTQTALADDEVEYEEREGFLWFFRYPLEGSQDHLLVATTRPETMLGDVALAVAPNDPRYAAWVGKRAYLPLTRRHLPIVEDHAVDADFGTGVVKVTPAHDPVDYEIGERHSLACLNIMTPDGRINAQGGEFQGLAMEEARRAVVEKMKQLNLFEKAVPHKHRVGISYRSKAVIEPYLSKQWFVRLSGFKQQLRATVEKKKVALLPAHWEHTYFHWIDHLRDWCISRQLWWGHQIPIWYSKKDPSHVLCYAGTGVPPEVKGKEEEWVQDEDVLDTWFSSALWPFSTLGWPQETNLLKKFYPNAVLVTGHDILFFWVARMILMGEFAMGAPPFPEVFLHGLIYGKSYWRYNKEGAIQFLDAQERLSYELGKPVPPEVQSKWEKMSKSKGNVIDPMELIDAYGADAMRLALAAAATASQQIDLDRRRFEEFKNFANKVWNGARFVFMNLGEMPFEPIDRSRLTLEDKWILSVLSRTIKDVNAHLAAYAFDKAAQTAYDFFWKELCAYYVELSKPILFGKAGTPEDKANKQKILFVLLCHSIRLLHPMAPFITEELFQLLKAIVPTSPLKPLDPYLQEAVSALSAPACAVAPFPTIITPEDRNAEIEAAFAFMDALTHAIRMVRAEMQIPLGSSVDVWIVGPRSSFERLQAEENRSILLSLVRIGTLSFTEEEPTLPLAASSVIGTLKIIIALPEEMRQKERVRLTKEHERWIKEQQGAKSKLSESAFLEKAPPALVEKLKKNLEESEKALQDIAHKLTKLSEI